MTTEPSSFTCGWTEARSPKARSATAAAALTARKATSRSSGTGPSWPVGPVRRACGHTRVVTPELDERLAAALDGADVDALIDVGCDLADLDRQDEALACFERAVALGEESMWFNVGNTLRELDRPLEAVDAYQRAVAAGQTDAWLNLGAVLERLGDLAGAMGAYRAAWDSGAQPDGYVNLAHLLREQGLAEDAEARLAEAAERDHPPAAALLACWQLGAHRRSRAGGATACRCRRRRGRAGLPGGAARGHRPPWRGPGAAGTRGQARSEPVLAPPGQRAVR